MPRFWEKKKTVDQTKVVTSWWQETADTGGRQPAAAPSVHAVTTHSATLWLRLPSNYAKMVHWNSTHFCLSVTHSVQFRATTILFVMEIIHFLYLIKWFEANLNNSNYLYYLSPHIIIILIIYVSLREDFPPHVDIYGWSEDKSMNLWWSAMYMLKRLHGKNILTMPLSADIS